MIDDTSVRLLETLCTRVRRREIDRTPALMKFACRLGDARQHPLSMAPLVVRAQKALTSIVGYPLSS